ncbi:hypothetical protein HDV03_000238 [Kappamyces sp. JEL0829]|nr:hypothetical protein HDV03_000238 [Kappamyces sp. JEL0829]
MTNTSPSLPKSQQKHLDRGKTLFVIVAALLIDLLAFTIILPLFPRLLKYYDDSEPSASLYRTIHAWVTHFRRGVSTEERLDIILFGGLVGSLYSFLQFCSAPVIGRLSDAYGRRTVLLWSMLGNALSMGLWMFADSFEVFLLSRIIGGLTEGNVQMSIAMISDISDASNRSKALALVGIAFSVGFTTGPPLGAYFASINLKDHFPSLPINSYSTPALFALVLIIVETVYMLVALPETLNRGKSDADLMNPVQEQGRAKQSLFSLSFVHFVFLFMFSGMEFTLTFLTYDRFGFTNAQQGKLLAFMGVLTALIQGGYVRRVKNKERSLVLQGIGSCSIGLYCIGVLAQTSILWLYVGVAFLAITSGTVVTCLTALASFEAASDDSDRGKVLGWFRSSGQLGRCMGPLVACTGYWILGSRGCYWLVSVGMAGLAFLTTALITKPHSVSKIKKD